MIQKVKEYVEKYHMLEENDRVVIGVSGGADSVCLLFLMCELRKSIPLELMVMHVEHGIRGEESLEDAAFVENLCREIEVPFYLRSIDVQKMAKEKRMTVEEAGREARYEAYESLHPTKIAVGHNANDVAETFLFHLFRGAGVKGLGGIAPVRDRIIRPLLGTPREEIEEYLTRNQIPYRTDITNLTLDYTRNKIRHVVLKDAGQINEQSLRHIAEAAEMIRQTEEYMEKMAAICFQTYVEKQENAYLMRYPMYQKEDHIMTTYVIRMCMEELAKRKKDITASHIKSVMALFEKQTGRSISLPYGLTAAREYEGVIIGKTKAKKHTQKSLRTEYAIEASGKVMLPDGSRIVTDMLLINPDKDYDKSIFVQEKPCTKWFDYDSIKNNVVFRTRRPGDYITVNKDMGTQKLKAFYINEKIERDDRDNMFILADGSHVMWIPGHRISEAYKVSDTTRRVWKVEWQKENEDE